LESPLTRPQRSASGAASKAGRGLTRPARFDHAGAVESDFRTRLDGAARATEAALEALLPVPAAAEEGVPRRLAEAMRYAVLGGGKRLRPFLLIESAALLGAQGSAVVAAAAAVECVHAYSLVHDDLPAMDNDDFRRGQPTLHRAFDEATAILAGDALLTLSFGILAGLEAPAESRATLAALLAGAAGAAGMVGGQVLDLAAVPAGGQRAATLHRLQAMKTGKLFAFSAEAGAVLAGGSVEDRDRLRRFGEHFGNAFQLADDLDDAEADKAGGRASLAVLLGAEEASRLLRSAVEAAQTALAPYGEGCRVLSAAVAALADG
jgi:farnesyl diphosphate synthase